MDRVRDKHQQARKARRRFGVLGEEWVVVLFLFAATVGLIAEQALRLGGSGIV